MWKLHGEVERRVIDPSFVTSDHVLPASRTARFRTTQRSKPGRRPRVPPIATRRTNAASSARSDAGKKA